MPKMTFIATALFVGSLLSSASPSLRAEGLVTPAGYLAGLEAPNFREGHTLPPLARWGWGLDIDTRIELAERWGYAIELGGLGNSREGWRVPNERLIESLQNPETVPGRLAALVRSDPKRYPASIVINHPLRFVLPDLPDELTGKLWVRYGDDGQGNAPAPDLDNPDRLIDAAAGGLVDGKRTWSPEAPDEVIETIAEMVAEPLGRIREIVPIAIVLNGGESGLGVYGFSGEAWKQDPRILAAKGERSWFDYICQRKAHEQSIVARAIRRATPGRALYIYYTTSGGKHKGFYPNWWHWAYQDHRWFRVAGDMASSEAYYRHYNSGWTGKRDMLTQALNAIGAEIACGDTVSYNWVCSGWPRGGDRGDVYADLDRYVGFLKAYYTAGMIGGVAGYFSPPNLAPFVEPPSWLEQIVALSRVHAFFSHFEHFLRDGYLLSGPERHAWAKDQPAYEFATGDSDARVLARRLRLEPQWLVTAWAAGGPERDVTATIPELGELTLRARPAGSVYRATLEAGRLTLELLDQDALRPSQHMEGRLPR